jgi:predicted O-methyltransferase YrrM
MKTSPHAFKLIIPLFTLVIIILTNCSKAQDSSMETDLDKQVKAFLDKRRGDWYDMNVPASDGKLLYEIIVKNGYTRALEIGTSTGHSSIWIAWALSKTGGKLITIEIDESRHREAVANIREAGLSEFVDARLADAHQLVRELDGPFDFIFSDADKGWYTNYFKDVEPKLERGGCFTAHNVRSGSWGRRGSSGTQAYLEYVQGLEGYTTTVDNSGGGVAISYKK